MKFVQQKALIFALALIIIGFSTSISAQTTAFTYQGKLTDTSAPLGNGAYDFEFALFSTLNGNSQIGAALARTGVALANGYFVVSLDFGAQSFSGTDRYLEIRVKKPSDASYKTLGERQRITSVPYSIRSLEAANAVTANTATNAVNATNATNADKLNNIDSSGFVQTNTNQFIRNQTATQASSEFHITGIGKANRFDAAAYFSIGGNRVLSVTGTANVFAGVGAGAANAGDNNSFFGSNAGSNNSGGSFNSFFGADAGRGNTTGDNNTFIGDGAGRK